MPPKNELTMLPMPWPRASWFLWDELSVTSSRMSWVRKVSIRPTREMARAVGRIRPRVPVVKGTCGMPNWGRPLGRVPRLLTVGTSRPMRIEIPVEIKIATRAEGTTLVKRGIT